MARPSKFERPTCEAIRQAIIDGATYEQAARAAGLHYDTFREWIKRGEAETDGAYHEFSESIKQAEALMVTQALADIRAAGSGYGASWQARAWLLERRYPDTYGRRAPQEMRHTGADGKPLEVKHTHEPERAARVADILAEAGVIVARAGGLGDEPPPD